MILTDISCTFSLRSTPGNENPDQSPCDNLPEAAATYAVGGMATHWTACTPWEHPTIERSDLLSAEEWVKLYEESEKLLQTNQTLFQHSIRNTVVKETLQKTYPELSTSEYPPQNIPLAGQRGLKAPEFITWTGADTILGEELVQIIKSQDASDDAKICLKVQQCSSLTVRLVLIA